MKLIDLIHERAIHPRRIRNLAAHLAEKIEAGSTLLDVGCGDGRLAAILREKNSLSEVYGVDVLIRSSVAIPVVKFNGTKIPCRDKSWEYVMAVDVLHHADDQKALLQDMLRVARKAVVIKDHLCENVFHRWLLRKMDEVGNDRHGVAVPAKYFSRKQWEELFRQESAVVGSFSDRIRPLPWPLAMIAGLRLHCAYSVSALQ